MTHWYTDNGDQIYRNGRRISGSAVVLYIRVLERRLAECVKRTRRELQASVKAHAAKRN